MLPLPRPPLQFTFHTKQNTAFQLLNMCHALPQEHPCNHISVGWNQCGCGTVDQETGLQRPCGEIFYTPKQVDDSACPLSSCDYANVDGNWTCCQCNGHNTGGWCVHDSLNPRWERNVTTGEFEWISKCNHTCCASCGRSGESCLRTAVPEPQLTN